MRRMKVVMEEKERYVKYDPDNDDIITRIIYDTIEKKPIIVTADRCIDLLNQQDKENQQLKALLKATEVTDIHNELADLQINNEWLESENQQLKQQLNYLPKKIVCEISEAIERLSWRKRIYTNWEFDKEQLYKDLDAILKKYGGEDE